MTPVPDGRNVRRSSTLSTLMHQASPQLMPMPMQIANPVPRALVPGLSMASMAFLVGVQTPGLSISPSASEVGRGELSILQVSELFASTSPPR